MVPGMERGCPYLTRYTLVATWNEPLSVCDSCRLPDFGWEGGGGRRCPIPILEFIVGQLLKPTNPLRRRVHAPYSSTCRNLLANMTARQEELNLSCYSSPQFQVPLPARCDSRMHVLCRSSAAACFFCTAHRDNPPPTAHRPPPTTHTPTHQHTQTHTYTRLTKYMVQPVPKHLVRLYVGSSSYRGTGIPVRHSDFVSRAHEKRETQGLLARAM